MVDTSVHSVSDLPAAAWHRDPTGRYSQRYWDGTQWTPFVASASGGAAAIDPLLPGDPIGPPGIAAAAPEAATDPVAVPSVATVPPPATESSPSPVPVAETDEGLGWLLFAATLLGLAGVMRVVDAFWALSFDRSEGQLTNGLLGDDIKTYGTVWLVVGVVLVIAAFGVVRRSRVARAIGFVAAAVAAVTAMLWMPYYPVWSLAYVLMAVLVFYALVRHGGRRHN